MEIGFVTSVAVVTTDRDESRRLFVDTLGLPLAGGDYLHSEAIEGTKSFGIWPLEQAAQACFGRSDWPFHLTVPQASIEFEVADADAVAAAADELAAAGFELLHGPRTEPWGQTVARVLTEDGLIVGVSYAPALHEQ